MPRVHVRPTLMLVVADASPLVGLLEIGRADVLMPYSS